ncbi:MAG: hypothetical protein LC800_17385 [Acidobacteria bacterium]|nr:hypothetical protein [Acidobacteriota bacterium]
MGHQEQARKFYADEREIEELVRGFENFTPPPQGFGHAEHLTVALWYLARLPESDAAERMRGGLKRFAAHHGSNLYHETITLFWLRFVGAFLRREGAGRAPHELANLLAASRADKRLVFDYYSRRLIETDGAKCSWVEPDLRPLNF